MGSSGRLSFFFGADAVQFEQAGELCVDKRVSRPEINGLRTRR